jgi:hypothetical protein
VHRVLEKNKSSPMARSLNLIIALYHLRLVYWLSKNRPFGTSSTYSVEATGLKLVPRPLSASKPPVGLAYANRYYYVSCGLLSFGFLMINRKIRKVTTRESIET